MSDPADLDEQTAAVLEAMKPRRRRSPRLAEPLREARDEQVDTPYGAVMAWRLDPWGSSGTAPATLLVHGWEDDNALWSPLIDQLQYLGRPVVALDLPGHGFSPAETCSVSRAAVAVRAVAKALGPVDTLVAHSFGCPVSTQAMADGLKVERAVLISTGWPNQAQSTRWTRIQEGLGVSDEAIAQARVIAARADSEFPPFDYEALAARMTAKALFLHSLDDKDTPPENSRTLADLWPGAALQWTDGLGHRRIAQDDAIVQGVVEFVEG
jgi:pimeloyl-ACP methyl ester carboxylesterase